MGPQPKSRMTVDAFLVWAQDHPGRYELYDGEVIPMSRQHARHVRTKFAIQSALLGAIRDRDLPCEMLPDGIAVQIDSWTSFEPDALVHCGEPLDPEAISVPAPVIIVEVVSLGTKSIDTGGKLEGYFRVPSVAHYLVVDSKRRVVIHHRRGSGDGIETRIVSACSLDLTPPGLSFDVADVFARP